MPHLPVAVRAFTANPKKRRKRKKAARRRDIDWPRDVVTFDTETTTDKTQRLTFGSYRYSQWSKDGRRLQCREEGLIYADELPERDPEGFERLKDYAEIHRASVMPGVPEEIKLLSRAEFAHEVLWHLGCQARTLIVGFNLPFDLSRLAIDCGAARGTFLGGFSLVLWENLKNKSARLEPNRFRPRIRIQHIDSKKAFIEFSRRDGTEDDDLRPAEGEPPDKTYTFPGRFLDLRTLSHALTSQGHSLASACDAFGVTHGKMEAEQHGVIDANYIAYNRRDVLASEELLEKLRVEFDRHPIQLDPCQAYSPASLAKAYFRAMGLRPPAERFNKILPEIHGQAMTAFYGGRAEVRIRKTVVPVAYTDFLSMYPTVQTPSGSRKLRYLIKLSVRKGLNPTRRTHPRSYVPKRTPDGCVRTETRPRLPKRSIEVASCRSEAANPRLGSRCRDASRDDASPG